MGHSFSWEKFNRMPLTGIVRNIPRLKTEHLAKYYYDAGLTTMEVTMNSAEAAETIARLVTIFGDTLNIGAGTVCSLKDLENALAAGAQFIVTPVINEEVITACVAAKVPIFPGAYTPTEIYRAWSLGAGMVKVFPAGKLGVEYIKEVLAPLDQIRLMPTGGITVDNFTGFLQAGAAGVGLGSSLFPKQLVEDEEWDALKIIFGEFVKRYNSLQHLPAN
jgi:2-dehydro-3-deoxyphosphogluconate aldolase / (4S)-4-hydroxy-2-oxoglutarate aldolase